MRMRNCELRVGGGGDFGAGVKGTQMGADERGWTLINPPITPIFADFLCRGKACLALPPSPLGGRGGTKGGEGAPPIFADFLRRGEAPPRPIPPCPLWLRVHPNAEQRSAPTAQKERQEGTTPNDQVTRQPSNQYPVPNTQYPVPNPCTFALWEKGEPGGEGGQKLWLRRRRSGCVCGAGCARKRRCASSRFGRPGAARGPRGFRPRPALGRWPRQGRRHPTRWGRALPGLR